jgi:hypothetical protein
MIQNQLSLDRMLTWLTYHWQVKLAHITNPSYQMCEVSINRFKSILHTGHHFWYFPLANLFSFCKSCNTISNSLIFWTGLQHPESLRQHWPHRILDPYRHNIHNRAERPWPECNTICVAWWEDISDYQQSRCWRHAVNCRHLWGCHSVSLVAIQPCRINFLGTRHSLCRSSKCYLCPIGILVY